MRAMYYACRLLRWRLDWGRTDSRTRYSLADCGGVRGVVLLSRNIGLHVRGRHYSHIMAQTTNLARPVMRRGARLHANKTGRELGEKAQYVLAPKSLL